ncbi:MAG: ABC transporter substrate-binding protein, partial [Eubacteriales bacterium]
MKNAKSKRIIIVVMILLAAAAVLLLSGCERKQETVPAAGTETAVPAESTESTAPAEETEPGLLRTAVLYDISTMDVAETTDDYLIPMNVFDRLFETRPATGSSEVVKSLVTDYSVSEDGLTYDFTLREGIVFSNGSPLTASDVQFSFERLLKAAKKNTEIPLEILGGEAVMKGEAESLEGFVIRDDTHFSITLAAPNAGFPAELSAPAASIVDAESMTPGFGKEPAQTIGSGPYIVTEWVSNDHYTLVYNDKYWGPEPSVKKLVVRVIADATTQDLMFRNSELDIIDLQNLDSAVVAGTYKTKPADRIVSIPKVGLTYLLMNENNQFLKDVNVRKAIGMAIDVDQIIQGIFLGDAQRENGIIPTGVWAHDYTMKGFTYDPEGAKALLKEAGYAEGEVKFELAMDSGANTSTQLVYAFISDQLKKVGIEATVSSYEHSAWLALRSSGEMDSFVARWGMDYNDPANIMYTFFGSEENSKGRSLNYPDRDIIARVSAVRSIVDDAEREAEYQALDKKLIEEDAAWIPMYAEL